MHTRSLLLISFIVMFLIGTDSFLVSPLLPTLQKEFGVTADVSGWLVSVYALGYACAALIAGPLSDGWNRRTVLFAGLLAFGLLTALTGLSSSFSAMLLLRFLAGAAASFVSPQIWAMLATLLPGPAIVRGMAVATAGLAASQALGVPIGSWLSSQHWSVPLFAVGIVSILVSLFFPFLLPSMPPQSSVPTGILQRYTPLARSRTARLTFAAYFVFQAGNFGAFTFIGTWLKDRFALDAPQIGLVMMCLGMGNLLGSLLSTRISAAFGSARILIAGILAIGIAYAGLPYLPNAAMVKAGFFTLFLVGGAVFPVLMGCVQSLSATSRGTVSSLANTVMNAGITIGSAAAGLLYARYGFAAVTAGTAVLYALAVLLFVKSGVLRGARGAQGRAAPAGRASA